MKSFEHGYLYDTPVSHALLRTMRALGEYRGRQALYTHQFPEILETLRRAAVVQSVESSSRIEGVVVAPGRIDPLVLGRSKPRDRSEQEVAGYRDVLAEIHTRGPKLKLGGELIRNWHRTLIAACKEFEERVGTISSARGAKRELVRGAVARLPARFTIGDLARACGGISRRTLVRALQDLRAEGGVRCLGRGPDAEWERTGR